MLLKFEDSFSRKEVLWLNRLSDEILRRGDVGDMFALRFWRWDSKSFGSVFVEILGRGSFSSISLSVKKDSELSVMEKHDKSYFVKIF